MTKNIRIRRLVKSVQLLVLNLAIFSSASAEIFVLKCTWLENHGISSLEPTEITGSYVVDTENKSVSDENGYAYTDVVLSDYNLSWSSDLMGVYRVNRVSLDFQLKHSGPGSVNEHMDFGSCQIRSGARAF